MKPPQGIFNMITVHWLYGDIIVFPWASRKKIIESNTMCNAWWSFLSAAVRTNLLLVQHHLSIQRTPKGSNSDKGLPDATDGSGEDVVKLHALNCLPTVLHGVQGHWVTCGHVQHICKTTERIWDCNEFCNVCVYPAITVGRYYIEVTYEWLWIIFMFCHLQLIHFNSVLKLLVTTPYIYYIFNFPLGLIKYSNYPSIHPADTV